MANEKFTIKEALNYGWETFKNHAGFLIAFVVIMFVVSVVPNLIATKLFEPESIGLLLSRLLINLVELFVGMAGVRIALDIHDKEQASVPSMGDLLALYPKYLVGKLIYIVLVMIGTVLLVIPGIIVAYMLLYIGYLIVDRHSGPIEALKESYAITNGYKFDLFLLSLVLLLINLVGFLLLFVGIFATVPTTLMASAYVYRRLSPAALPTV